MSSLQNKSIGQHAVNLCNNYTLKRELLCASGSCYERSTIDPLTTSRFDVWIDMVEKAAVDELKPLPGVMKKKVEKLVIPIGMSMLTWATYHEKIIGVSREFSIDVLDPSCFTPQGQVDNKSMAGKLMEDKSLNIQEKYKLACLYCFEDNIKDLYGKLTPEDTRIMLSESSEQTEFWIHYSRGEADRIRGEKTMDEYRLEWAVESGSKAAVEYSWKTIPSSDPALKNVYVQNAAIRAIRCSIRHEMKDYVIFHPDVLHRSWVPSTYYIDILFFLLSKMTEGEKREFLERDTFTDYTDVFRVPVRRSLVLEYSLSWPYQDGFMETASQMWEFLPENSYAELLLTICYYIGLRSGKAMPHVNENFSYRQLLVKFWEGSPKRYRDYVLGNNDVACRKEGVKQGGSLIALLSSLLFMDCYDDPDDEAVRLILACATDAEKRNVTSDLDLGQVHIKLANEKKFRQLNTLSHCFASIVDVNTFKSEFFRDWRGQHVFIASLNAEKWEGFKEFAAWCALPEDMLKQYKKELIQSNSVVFSFLDFLLLERDMVLADRILMWCFSSAQEIKTYKRDLVSLHASHLDCRCFLSQEKTNIVDMFNKWCLSSKKDIKRLKRKVLDERGTSICRELFYKCFMENYVSFEESEWRNIDNFFNWCLLTDKEASEFKKNIILGDLGEKIFSRVIQSNHENDAENFFAWLKLPAHEINTLKKATLRKHLDGLIDRAESSNESYLNMRTLVTVERRSDMSVCWGFDWQREETERYLKFCLTEKKVVNEFRKKLDEDFAGRSMLTLQEVIFDNFCKMIGHRLKDIEKETGVKRRFGAFFF